MSTKQIQSELISAVVVKLFNCERIVASVADARFRTNTLVRSVVKRKLGNAKIQFVRKVY
jgi:hypothetical protein